MVSTPYARALQLRRLRCAVHSEHRRRARVAAFLVPELASVLSAYGAATADVRRERLKAVLGQFPMDPRFIEKEAAELKAAVLEDLAADGIPSEHRQVDFEADLRFRRQVWEIPIRSPPASSTTPR